MNSSSILGPRYTPIWRWVKSMKALVSIILLCVAISCFVILSGISQMVGGFLYLILIPLVQGLKLNKGG